MRPTDPRVVRQLLPARRQLAAAMIASVVAAGLVIAQAWVVTGLVVAALDGEDVGRWAWATAATLLARGAVGLVVDVSVAGAAGVVATDLRRRLAGALLRLRASGEDTRSTGSAAVLATRGVAATEPYLTRYVPALLLAAVVPAATVVAIATQDLLSAAIVAGTLPLVPIFGALVGLATRDRAAVQWRAMSQLSGHFVDVVRGLPTLVAFRRARAQSDTIRRVTDRYRRASLGTLRLAFASSAVLELVATLSVALVAVTVGVRLAEGGLGLSTALVVLLLAPEAYWPLRRMGAEFHASAEGAETFETVAAITDRAGEDTARSGSGAGTGALVVERVSVTRPGRAVPALPELSAVIPARGVTALVGPSGCGKSTLLAVLSGLVAPTTGRVTVAGEPVAGDGWRRQVALLPQRPVFVPGSIADNLRLARPDATVEDLWAVLRRVVLEERVRAHPLGLAAPVGQDGAHLSAGERARLALARVLLADRPWVLLDEPTAHLDELTGRVIADAILELGRDHGVVVVAHQPELVALAQTVVELPAPPLAASRAERPATDVTEESSEEPTEEATDHATGDSVGAPDGTPRFRPRTALGLATGIGGLASASGVALTATAGWLIVQASTQPPVLTLLVAVVSVRAFGLARPLLRYVERVWSHDVALRLLADRRVRVYDALVPLTPGRLGRRRGDLLAGVVDDVDGVVDRELRVRLPLRGYAVVWALSVLTALLVLPAAAPVVAAAGLAGPALAYVLARYGAGRAERRTVAARAALSERLVDTLAAAEELTMWQRAEEAAARVAGDSDRLTGAVRSSARWLGAARGAVLASTGAAMAAVAVLGERAHAAGDVSGPMLALLVLLPLAVGEVAAGVPDAGALAARCAAAEERLDELTARTPAVTDPGRPQPLPADPTVEVQEVSVGWGATPAVRDLDLHLAPGDRVAVVGPSGSGKSTVAAMLLRFVDPSAGQVRLGGIPAPALALDDVRRTVGLVDDDPHLFATTLVENVRLARPEATDAEVADALRAARLGPWLATLPDGLHSWLGDGHAQVSGGERARIGIARCLLADQPVVVLDEPVAHLDHATAEALAVEVLERGGDRRAVLWITHVPVGLDRVDRVVDLAGRPWPVAADVPTSS